MKIKNLSIVGTVIFLSVLVTPMLFVNFSGGEISERENRVFASRPPISLLFTDPTSFVNQFDNWFSDNIGFREYMINSYKAIDSLDVRVQYTDGQYTYLVGEEGHHFFAHTNGWMINKFQGEPFLSQARLTALVDGLSKIKAFLDERNIPFVVMFATDKETIYPEFYPKSIKKGEGEPQLETITKYVREKTYVDVFNLIESLYDEKENYLLYPKDNKGDLAHYNEMGAFFAYQELMEHIDDYIPNIHTFQINDIDILKNENGVVDIKLKNEASFKLADAEFFDGVDINHASFEAYENLDSELPTILIMRDSYMGSGIFLSRYIPRHFGKTISFHFYNMKYFYNYVELFEPDIVVFEVSERELVNFSNAFSLLYE
jgi:hypothetical protein